MKKVLVILITLLVAVPATWLATRYYITKAAEHVHSGAAKGERKVLYYQSAMHPWIKSDKWDPLESTCRHASLSIL